MKEKVWTLPKYRIYLRRLGGVVSQHQGSLNNSFMTGQDASYGPVWDCRLTDERSIFSFDNSKTRLQQTQPQMNLLHSVPTGMDCCRTSAAIPSRTTLFTIIHQPDNVTKPREAECYLQVTPTTLIKLLGVQQLPTRTPCEQLPLSKCTRLICSETTFFFFLPRRGQQLGTSLVSLPLATIWICRVSESVAFSSSEAYSTTSSISRTDVSGRNQTQPSMVPRRQAEVAVQ
ncbi:hypothetical protein YC2023_005722 [Brassica napus]